ncbi:TVP38/TMEM64 family protein [Facilibium subflavum]|uniref:TVP38/TMEM64 family protein n=1 Tax=Facilibium subflavum TaxID=2219058 RepID=UPI000E65864D|nr:TVP38/TMEM64 family protein [Facilibium subflavum]
MRTKTLWPIILLAIGFVLFFSLGGERYLHLDTIAKNYQYLQRFTTDHYFLSVILYMLIYVAIVAFSVPGATVMTLLGGFLFGTFLGGIWAILSATIGATMTFLAVKIAFAEALRQKAKGSIRKMRDGFKKNELNYIPTLTLLNVKALFYKDSFKTQGTTLSYPQ